MIVAAPSVYAGGPRGDYSETYEDVPGAPECWVDGYDAGFAGKYDKDRANECNDIPGDQYNASWDYGCKNSGLTENSIAIISISLELLYNLECENPCATSAGGLILSLVSGVYLKFICYYLY